MSFHFRVTIKAYGDAKSKDVSEIKHENFFLLFWSRFFIIYSCLSCPVCPTLFHAGLGPYLAFMLVCKISQFSSSGCHCTVFSFSTHSRVQQLGDFYIFVFIPVITYYTNLYHRISATCMTSMQKHLYSTEFACS